ncbi:hypothetical protein [Chryseobacterium sp. EO14]|uniref:hypothetical protein n=1 Tax=Chryseobacterium sp. EO14 TaxID=2950551 RepID=UPI00210BECFE|nr:hypothetical protein [Chryseobacterium sp. EO14]MCQ4139241.1 hypothetical protein [Chryseobacterium sp. EO14]
MPNIITLNVVYDSSGLLTGQNPIDLIMTNDSDNKIIKSNIYNMLADPPEIVSSIIDSNTKILTKIEDFDGSYILVSDAYGTISDQMYSLCPDCNFQSNFCDCEGSGIGTETDPVFTASPAYNITSSHINFLNLKDYNSLNNLPNLSLKADLIGGKVPASQLPSYVDDVLEYSALSNFPNPGESGKLYVTQDNNIIYRWTGSSYIEVSSASITTNGTAGQISFFSTASNISSDGNLLWDNSNKRLAVGVTSPTTSIDTNTLRLRTLPNGISDSSFTRNVIIKNDGTVGYEAKLPTYYPKVTINSYSQDATNYILKVTVSNIPSGGFSSTGGYFSISAIGSNSVDAVDIVVTFDSLLGFVINGNLQGADFTITFPKASNTSPVWNNPNVLIGVLWKGTDNADGGTSSPYKPRRFAQDAKLIKEASLKQDLLISGTNIKTINGTSLLGSGDILTTNPISTILLTNSGASLGALNANTTVDINLNTNTTWSVNTLASKTSANVAELISASGNLLDTIDKNINIFRLILEVSYSAGGSDGTLELSIINPSNVIIDQESETINVDGNGATNQRLSFRFFAVKTSDNNVGYTIRIKNGSKSLTSYRVVSLLRNNNN